MDMIVSATEFKNRAGQYLDESGKNPVFITRHERTVRVLVDIDEYTRLKSYDTRKHLYPYQLSDEMKAELEKGFTGRETPELDHLLED